MIDRQLNIRKKAFNILFKKALGAREYSHVSLIYDESFAPYFTPFSEIVKELCLPVTYLFIPIDYQELLLKTKRFVAANGDIHLPKGIKAAISNSDIVLSMLNGDIRYASVRAAIIAQKKGVDCKVAHCPGLSDEILDLILRSPYQKIQEHSEMLAWALGNAESAVLRTRGVDNEEHTLEMKLDGWNNEPFISSGIIFDGSWGNIPPGETFCCPDPAGVNGSICINGSLPDVILRPGQQVILTFREGKLVSWDAGSDPQLNAFFEKLETHAEARKDNNWNTFAELGIGLNPEIKKLTGNSLFDEKMANTVHVAIGNNMIFGHHVKSSIHVDMVTFDPDLILDGRSIIENGVLLGEKVSQWRRRINFSNTSLKKVKRIYIDSAKIKVSGLTLQRRFENGGRVGMVDILNNKYKKVLINIKETLETEIEIPFSDLVRKAGRGQRQNLLRVLEILHYYKAIDIIEP